MHVEPQFYREISGTNDDQPKRLMEFDREMARIKKHSPAPSLTVRFYGEAANPTN